MPHPKPRELLILGNVRLVDSSLPLKAWLSTPRKSLVPTQPPWPRPLLGCRPPLLPPPGMCLLFWEVALLPAALAPRPEGPALVLPSLLPPTASAPPRCVVYVVPLLLRAVALSLFVLLGPAPMPCPGTQ